MNVRAMVAIAVVAGLAGCSGSSLDAATQSKIDADVVALMKLRHVNGATISVVRDNKTVYEKGYGMRDVARNLPADPATNYEIGSISKEFTAAAVMQLVEAGTVDLNALASKYVPSAPHGNRITVRQLLSHTSGLHEYLDTPNKKELTSKPATPGQVVAIVANRPLDFEPGTKFGYSNENYFLLGMIVEAAVRQSYNDYVREHLLTPAGISDAATTKNIATVPNMAAGYSFANGKSAPVAGIREDWTWAAGNLIMTAGALVKWNDALQTGRIVSKATFAKMSEAVPLADGQSSGYGLGFEIGTFQGQPSVGHDGETYGFASSDQMFPKQNAGIVVLTNEDTVGAAFITAAIFNDLFPDIAARARAPLPGEDPATRKRIVAFALPLVHGKLDRSQLTPQLDAFFSEQMVAAVIKPAANAVEPTFVYRGMTATPKGPIYAYLLRYPELDLKLNVQIDKATNKISYFEITQP
jgi:CubicO group peptidase (beta-lactamase class C family)